MNKLSLPLMLIALTAAGAEPDALSFQSGPEQTALLELYTSEGCSSCPPAEAWLSRLQDSPRLWKEFTPVAFHVDYWDYLGWRDTWAKGEFSERQRGYAQRWRNENIYTPEFVLNGKEWRDWRAGENEPSERGPSVGVLVVTSSDQRHWRMTFAPSIPADAGFDVHAALLAGGIVSAVKAGENRGRDVHHDFVVLKLVQAGTAMSNGTVRGEFTLEAPVASAGETLALAVWITRVGQLDPLQATGGWLLPPAAKRR